MALDQHLLGDRGLGAIRALELPARGGQGPKYSMHETSRELAPPGVPGT